MTISEIISILENRLLNLNETRKAAVQGGLLDQIQSIDYDIATTIMSINTLKATL